MSGAHGDRRGEVPEAAPPEEEHKDLWGSVLEGRARRRQVAIVLWNGTIGGAETLMVQLAAALRAEDVDAHVLFVCEPEPLAERLDDQGIPWSSLAHARGAEILLGPRHLARALEQLGPDGAIVNATGYLPWLIRRGGFVGPLLAVEHGDALNLGSALLRRRLRVRLERLLCARANYLDIAVSDHVLQAAIGATGRKRVRRIYNGVDLERFSPAAREPRGAAPVRIGVACRLAPGKGVDVLLAACALLGRQRAWCLRIAGEGPEAERLRALAGAPPLAKRVVFEGRVTDMPAFWGGCDVAVVPSAEWIESFSMAAVEAMACGLPLIATASGALPEICGEGATLVAPGDATATAAALAGYIDDPQAREATGAAGRARAERMFSIAVMAAGYVDALGDPDSRGRSDHAVS
jgi:glycosyltransferase involved in cell wall biosynthesis